MRVTPILHAARFTENGWGRVSRPGRSRIDREQSAGDRAVLHGYPLHVIARSTSFIAGVALVLLPATLSAQAPPVVEQPPPPAFKLEVIGATPLPGVDLLLEEIPAPVQTALSRDIDASGALDLADFLNRRINGVFVNEMQGNPFQPDVNYRGFTASPLLGTPQGLSIYMDGVRLNQAFGDVVSWDLIPRIAIGSIALMPGSNPLFGLNTLGGALAIQTKDGRNTAGTSVQAIYGNNARRAIEFETGGSHTEGLNWYLAGNLFAEDGWREASPSNVGQLFGKLGWHDAETDLSFSGSYANDSLTGNGLQEQRFLASDYASVYTIPDTTENRAGFFNLTIKQSLSETVTWSGNAYYRDIRTNAFNGDINNDSLDQSVYQPSVAEQAALAAAGYTGVPTSGANASNTPFPSWRCIGNVLLNDEPGEKCNGLLNTTHTAQHNYGAFGQVTAISSPHGTHNQFMAGGGFDGSRVAFQQSTQLGYLNPDRSITGVDAYADGGVTGGNVDGVPYDTRVDLNNQINTWSLYATDTISMGDVWHATVSARYNRSGIANHDNLQPGSGPGSLDGDYVYARLNPAAGLTFSPSRAVNLYVGYSEGSRAPTSIELGCADPKEPCKLPNAMAGDPPLNQVVTRTWEAGVRGSRAAWNWNAGMFHAVNRDDILFVSSAQTGFGYFRNFGRTRRQGLELGLAGHVGLVDIGAGYTWLDATYESPETIDATGNSTNSSAVAGGRGLEGTIDIEPGDRLPLIPRNSLKVYADVKATTRLSVDVDLVSVSSSYARGNENNQHQPDGTYYLGPGTSPAYAVVNLGARYKLWSWMQLIAQVNNLFDTHYYTAAQLGPTGFTATGNFIARPLPAVNGQFPVQQATFYAPGAPTIAWFGARFKF
jgi:outer membrane receptor protein involved in Fe transport